MFLTFSIEAFLTPGLNLLFDYFDNKIVLFLLIL